ncbi:hypothetical protein NKH77_39720 [Streptomyces sp. M19]
MGPVILDLLPGPNGLEDDEAAAVVRTAALVGGDAALTLLKRYRHHDSGNVKHALMVAWESFEAEEYMEEVLRHVHQPDRLLIVVTSAHLPVVAKMDPPENVRFIGDFNTDQILGAVDPIRITDLDISVNSEIRDLGFLRSFPNLRRLELFECFLDDYSPVAELNLVHLLLHEALEGEEEGASLHTLASLQQLRSFHVERHIVHETLESFPLFPELRVLSVGSFCELTSLSGIEKFTRLTSLHTAVQPLARTSPEEFAALKRLTSLTLTDLGQPGASSFDSSPTFPTYATSASPATSDRSISCRCSNDSPVRAPSTSLATRMRPWTSPG